MNEKTVCMRKKKPQTTNCNRLGIQDANTIFIVYTYLWNKTIIGRIWIGLDYPIKIISTSFSFIYD